MMKIDSKAVSAGLLAVLIGGYGCSNIGNAPSGESSSDMKAAFDKLPLDDKANQLLDAPGPLPDKVTKIKGWYTSARRDFDSIQKRMGGGGPGSPQ